MDVTTDIPSTTRADPIHSRPESYNQTDAPNITGSTSGISSSQVSGTTPSQNYRYESVGSRKESPLSSPLAARLSQTRLHASHQSSADPAQPSNSDVATADSISPLLIREEPPLKPPKKHDFFENPDEEDIGEGVRDDHDPAHGMSLSANRLGSVLGGSHFGLNEDPIMDLKEEGFPVLKDFVSTARLLFAQDGVDTFTDVELHKWLHANKNHRGRALSALSDTLTWRRQFNVDKLKSEDFSAFEASGYLHFFGSTHDGTPILFFNGSRRKPAAANSANSKPPNAMGATAGPGNTGGVAPDAPGWTRERELRYIIYVLEQAKTSGILKDKLYVVIDRTGMSRGQQSDASLVSSLVPLLQKHYPERLKGMVIFPTGTLFWMGWKMTQMLIDPATKTKIQLKDDPSILLVQIDQECLFERYGGRCPDPFAPSASLTTQPSAQQLGVFRRLSGGRTLSETAKDEDSRSTDSLDKTEGNVVRSGNSAAQLLVEDLFVAPDCDFSDVTGKT